MPRSLLPPRGIFVPTMMVYPPLHGPHLDPATWVALAEELDRHDRIYGARRRLAIFQQILTD
jgi:hypothetical protein